MAVNLSSMISDVQQVYCRIPVHLGVDVDFGNETPGQMQRT
jgi:hypothetical protein